MNKDDSISQDSPVTFHKTDDPELLQASQQARDTFRSFWNQISLDFNRIIPALDMASLKVPFSDDLLDPESPIEHMWVNQITFDGIQIQGVLLNAPNWLKSIGQGDEVRFPLAQISDWLCVLDGKVYGAHTIQLIRARMNSLERTEYDQAWGLDFPSPDTVLIPERNQKFEDVIANLIVEQIAEEPAITRSKFDHGRTLLHLEALYGRTPSVRVLLERGASPIARCDRGWTPLDYAQSLEWIDIIRLLEAAV